MASVATVEASLIVAPGVGAAVPLVNWAMTEAVNFTIQVRADALGQLSRSGFVAVRASTDDRIPHERKGACTAGQQEGTASDCIVEFAIAKLAVADALILRPRTIATSAEPQVAKAGARAVE